MQKVLAVVSTLFRCGIIGGLYGAVLGVTYILLLGVADDVREHVPFSFFLSLLPVLLWYGTLFGFPTGFVSGVVGGCLGGPVGYGLGGVLGTGALLLTFTGGVDGLRAAKPGDFCMVAWGAASGLVLGQHIRRRVPLFPGVEWLADCTYSSPLRGWLGWRQQPAK
jgi:hypothetical protein